MMITFDLAVDILALVPSRLDHWQLHQTLDGLQVRQQVRIFSTVVVALLLILCRMDSVPIGHGRLLLIVLLRRALSIGIVCVAVATAVVVGTVTIVAVLSGRSVNLLVLLLANHVLLLILVIHFILFCGLLSFSYSHTGGNL